MRLANDGFPNFINQQLVTDQAKNVQMQFGADNGDKNLPKKFNVYPEPQGSEIATLFYRNTINYASKSNLDHSRLIFDRHFQT